MMLSLSSIMENVVEKQKKKFSMVAFFVPKHISEKLQILCKEIEGDAVQIKDEHITLGLMERNKDKENNILSALREVAQQFKPVQIKINSLEFFEPSVSSKNRYVLFAKPECDEFKSIHQCLIQTFHKRGISIGNGDFKFTPHITIKYCEKKPDIDKKINLSFVVDKIAFAISDKHYFINLG